jgi:hypothetical protein
MSSLLGRGRRFAGRARRGGLRRARAVATRLTLPHEGIPGSLLAAKRRDLAEGRTFGAHDLDALSRLLERADEVVPVREAFSRRDDWPERFLALRHDMDHDVENSVRLAEWEAEHGYRATYYVLHGDWYWGGPATTSPAPFVLRALDRIASLGHEIGLHNNAITLALLTGQDPHAILERDLASLRRAGFAMDGSVAHGDRLCHTLGYVNSELFSECPRPALGAPDRTIVYDDPSSRTRRTVRLQPRPMADFGLTHEANLIGHTLYLSDTGGRWNRSFAQLDDLYAREGGFLQVLVHPVWWALSGEVVRPRPTIVPAAEPAAAAVGNPDAPPFPIVVRGDCCSRRAIDMNRDLFGGNPQMVRDEKARTDFFLDGFEGLWPTREDVRRWMDVDRMSKSLRTYALGQVDRDTLRASEARLLVFDDYADMNFAAWHNRAAGWKIWIHQGYLWDRAEFERAFEPLGQLTFGESLADHVRLIETYRSRLGHVPVLYLHQPVTLYPKLEARGAEFRRLGPELERIVPDLFAGDLHDDELEPDDLGSCGPGQTLHFTGPTYRKMIQVAMEKGLGAWLTPR